MSAITLNARASADFEAKLAQTQQVLQEATAEFARGPHDRASSITLACSLGAEDMVLAHLVNILNLDVDIFVLDTGHLHAQTQQLLTHLRATSKVPVKVIQPNEQTTTAYVQREGPDAMYRSIALRKACCDIRKMEPLARALVDKKAWITGLRREQSGARSAVPLADRSGPTHVKFNPLSLWNWGDVWHFIQLHGVTYNPLHDEFFPSVGCAPCTRAISLGEDFRAGRWWWEDDTAKECGLHVSQVIPIQEAA